MDPMKIPNIFDVDMLLETLVSIGRERTLDGVFKAGKDYFLKRPQVAATGIWLSEDKAGILRLVWGVTRSNNELKNWQDHHGKLNVIPFDHEMIGAAARDKHAIIRCGKKWDRPEWAKKENVNSYIVLPMVFKGEFIGILGFFYFPFFAEGLNNAARWLKLLSDYTASAISNAKSLETIQLLSKRLAQENQYLREEFCHTAAYEHIIGESDALKYILEQISIVAPIDVNVLITGESGTGKELIARAIHRNSKRAQNAFIKVNCASIPSELFESEFFGHIQGAFTGAIKNRIGRFQLADRGTLMLDEVSEMPLELQGKLLRVLQEGEFERVGEIKTKKVSVRIIAVTNRELKDEVKSGRFREDLYFRLSVFPIEAPPLRDREDDVILLVKHFIKEAVHRLRLPEPLVNENDITMLSNLDWPGNVRELKNAVERAVIISRGGKIDFGFLNFDKVKKQMPSKNDIMFLDEIIKENDWKDLQRHNILRALRASNGKIQGKFAASELLGIKPTTLRSRMESLGISKREYIY